MKCISFGQLIFISLPPSLLFSFPLCLSLSLSFFSSTFLSSSNFACYCFEQSQFIFYPTNQSVHGHRFIAYERIIIVMYREMYHNYNINDVLFEVVSSLQNILKSDCGRIYCLFFACCYSLGKLVNCLRAIPDGCGSIH